MKSFGNELSKERVVQKLLISLPRSYNSIFSVIKYSKDYDTLEVRKVVASLKGLEQRLGRHVENSTKRAVASLNEGSKYPKSSGSLAIKRQRKI